MGSFYSTCSISNMTLVNQKTSIQLLVPNFNLDLGSHKDMIISDDGCMCFFAPFGFPIHGEYKDSGQICNIIVDDNVKMLEEFFNISIYDILENIQEFNCDDNSKIKNKDLLLKLQFTYFRTEVLEYLENGWGSLLNTNIDSRSIEFDFDFNNMWFYFNKVNGEIKSFNHKLETGNLTDSERNDLIIKIDNVTDIANDIKLAYCYIPRLISKRYNMFNVLPIINDKFYNYIAKQYWFLNRYSYKLNRILLPSVCGGQDDNYAETYKLNNFINSLLEKEINNG